MSTPEQRPLLTSALSGRELRRWYWLKDELAVFAREVGLSASGSKPELTDRIAAHLDGLPPPPTAVRRTSQRGAQSLAGPLTRATVIPPGQRATTVLRRYFEAEIGPAFRFDGFMRSYLTDNPGRTLGDAVAHWHATRDAEPREPPQQLEYNRFTRSWHRAHPDGSAAECRAAWRQHRSLPTEKRLGPEA